MPVCTEIINFMIHFHPVCTILINHFYTILTSVVLTIQLHICDIISQCCVFLCRMSPSEDGRKKDATFRWFAIWLYTFAMWLYTSVSNCFTVVGINVVKNTCIPPSLTLKTLFLYTPYVFRVDCKGGYTLVTLPRIVTPYRDSVDGTRNHVTYQKLITR